MKYIHKNQTSWANNWKQQHINYRGNPFYPDYLEGHYHLFQSITDYPTILNQKTPNQTVDTLTRVDSFTETLRYSKKIPSKITKTKKHQTKQ